MNAASHPRSSKLWLPVVVVAVAGVAVDGWLHFHDGHDATHHSDHAPAALALNEGQRWTTDAPLRTGMQGIRNAVNPALAAHAEKRLTAEAATALAGTVQTQVNHLFENCKLPPKADATLHVIITDLLSGSAQLAGNPASAEGATLLAQALQRYPEYFDHPEWSPSSGTQR